MRILITGGAGFVGSSLARQFKEKFQKAEIITFDNLHRRGSELNLQDFKKRGIQFNHGDIRNPRDFDSVEGSFDLLIEASAEPSVLAGVKNSPAYLLDTNLVGTIHCLEFAKQRCKQIIFLSTSRVYSLQPLKELPLVETTTRFEIPSSQSGHGFSSRGINEDFPTHLPRSLYGATKLASELLVQEYLDAHSLQGVINRCGVIAGPGQFGKVDQGVFTLWVAHHFFKKSLVYTGFQGKGKQVRDLLHPEDLFCLLLKQIEKMNQISGAIVNVGGGLQGSTSLLEFTQLCQKVTGKTVEIKSKTESASVDIPFYVSDCAKAQQLFDWQPQYSVGKIAESIDQWIKENHETLRGIFI